MGVTTGYKLWFPKLAPASKPASRWVNRWRKVSHENVTHGGIARQIGEEFSGTRVWPSKDSAETAAGRAIDRVWKAWRADLCEYIGAVPVEE
jgi:hypothetical protein